MNASSSHHPSRSHGALHTLAHHLVVALAVASIVGLVHAAGLLGWLDAAMLRLTGATVEAGTAATDDPAMPEVLLIGEPLYDARFQLRSPLDRAALSNLLLTTLFPATDGENTRKAVPRVLVLDIDVSADGHHADTQPGLDEALRTLVQRGTSLVLPMPLPSVVKAVQASKLAWMKDACGWGGSGRVWFASSEITPQGGQVLQFDSSHTSLGVAAAHPGRGTDGCSLRPDQRALHLNTLTQPHAPRLGDSGDWTRQAKLAWKPFNAAYFKLRARHEHWLGANGSLPKRPDGEPIDLNDKVVFLGGAYDARDRFESPWIGQAPPSPGVTFHAATYYSGVAAVWQSHVLDFAVDVVIGLLAGYAFHAMWGFYRRTRSVGGWAGYVMPKLAYAGIVVLALFAAAGLVSLAAQWAYPRNVWINPGPMILGVFAKVVLSAENHDPRELPAASWLVTWTFVVVLITIRLVTLAIH